jgi:Ca-activated chloride channel homolog
VTEVFAVLPFGETLPLKFLDGEGVWEARFLAPSWMADGTYNCRLLLRDKDGNGYEEKKSFVIDSRAPKLKVDLDRKNVRAGDVITVKVLADSDARRINARMYAAQPVDLHWSTEQKANIGTIRVSENIASGHYTLTVSAEDFAHNQSQQEIQIEVTGR